MKTTPIKVYVKDTPLESYAYLEVSGQQSKDGESIIKYKDLPIFEGQIHDSKASIDLLIICSDLQGMVKNNDDYLLLGEVIPSFLKTLIGIEYEEKGFEKIGVLLCGDFFTSLEKRGTSGDVRKVWNSFKKEFDWVVGVAGNHDSFGTMNEKEEFLKAEGIHLLHNEILEKDHLRIGGISGIIGRKDKLNRMEEKEYLNALSRMLKKDIDVILLHETPDFPQKGFIGNSKIRETIEKAPTAFICAGHCHWSSSLVEFENNSQTLNIDSKVILLKIVNG